MKVLVINAGSSSLKYQLIDLDTQTVMAKGLCECLGTDDATFKHAAHDQETVKKISIPDHDQAVALVIEALTSGPGKAIDSLEEIDAVGHRIVQGGSLFDRSVVIDNDVTAKIDELAAISPLHNKAALQGIYACQNHMPQTPMVAVFDSAFFHALPPQAKSYALPYELCEKHAIKRYGAHGTSHRYISERAAALMGKDRANLRIITCHLGNGCSLAAINQGNVIDTSMGLTPLDGLMMGTRCGAIDPAIVTYLMEKEGFTPQEMDDVMNKKSGLLGVSGISNDMRAVNEAASQGNERAILAIDMFALSVKKFIGAYMAEMNGVDCIAFAGGVGENSPEMRAKILEGMDSLGIVIDEEANNIRSRECRISADDSAVTILVVPTNEELMIARDAHDLVSASK